MGSTDSFFFSFYIWRFIILIWLFVVEPSALTDSKEQQSNLVELLDEKWDQIQKGQWLIGFFDKETEESQQLEKDWQVFALKCKEQAINVGRVFAPQNPGLYVRFLITSFPKVFYVKNGVAHEVKKPSHETIMNLVKNNNWSDLKPVNFLSNPFSVQMSLLSHMFVHAVNLYNFEDAIVKEFLPFSSATDIVFGLTFIIVGTFLGLVLTVAFGLFQVFFMDTKDTEEEKEEVQKSEGRKETKVEDDEEEKEEGKKTEDRKKTKVEDDEEPIPSTSRYRGPKKE